MVLKAPRSLNEPIGCRFSNLSQISAGPPSTFNRTSGVRTVTPARRSRAARISSRVGARSSRMDGSIALTPGLSPAGTPSVFRVHSSRDPHMLTLLVALRATARSLRRSPGFFLIAVLTLAVGIGANAAIFTVLDAVLLKPLPYPEPERIMGVSHTAPGMNAPPRFELSDGTYFVFRRDGKTLEELGIYGFGSVTLNGGQEPERIAVTRATASV